MGDEHIPFPNHDRDHEPSYPSAFQEVIQASKRLLMSEAKLIRAEIKQGVRQAEAGTFLAMTGLLGVALGALSFLAFSILLIGKFLNERYWLSSLVVSAFFFSLSLMLWIILSRKLRLEDRFIPQAKQTLTTIKQIRTK